jgi:hypothetical protein
MKIIKRIQNNKGSIVVSAINNLIKDYSVIEMYNKIVIELGLCSKATFYRHLSNLKRLSPKNEFFYTPVWIAKLATN